jgi:hypothetical protein
MPLPRRQRAVTDPLIYQQRTVTAITPKRFSEFDELNLAALQEDSILQYNSTDKKWEAISSSGLVDSLIDTGEFVDALIDGGDADSDDDYVDVFNLDGGGA